MNGYLLFAVCNLDDIPVQFFPEEGPALAAAATLEPPTHNPLASWDITGFIGAKVLRFEDGTPRGPAVFIQPHGGAHAA